MALGTRNGIHLSSRGLQFECVQVSNDQNPVSSDSCLAACLKTVWLSQMSSQWTGVIAEMTTAIGTNWPPC